VLDVTDGSGQVTRRAVEIMSARRQMLRTPLGSPPTALRVDPDGALLLTASVKEGKAAQ
jgi:hypothetical protein